MWAQCRLRVWWVGNRLGTKCLIFFSFFQYFFFSLLFFNTSFTFFFYFSLTFCLSSIPDQHRSKFIFDVKLMSAHQVQGLYSLSVRVSVWVWPQIYMSRTLWYNGLQVCLQRDLQHYKLLMSLKMDKLFRKFSCSTAFLNTDCKPTDRRLCCPQFIKTLTKSWGLKVVSTFFILHHIKISAFYRILPTFLLQHRINSSTNGYWYKEQRFYQVD